MMRKFTLLIAIALVVFACKKGDLATPQTSDIRNIYGKWDWVKSTGGIAGVTLTPKSEGYAGTLMIANDNTLSSYQNTTLKFHDSFTITKDTALTHYPGILTFKTNGTINYVMKATTDTLVMGDNFADGFTSLYVRIKN